MDHRYTHTHTHMCTALSCSVYLFNNIISLSILDIRVGQCLTRLPRTGLAVVFACLNMQDLGRLSCIPQYRDLVDTFGVFTGKLCQSANECRGTFLSNTDELYCSECMRTRDMYYDADTQSYVCF